MRAPNRRKRGFTLIETVVTVGIVAALAAVVYPQVVKQFDAADPARLQNDLKNLQTSIESFSVNVKASPGDLDDLANAIATSDSSLTTGASLLFNGTSQTPLWNGPYIDFALLDIVDGTAEATHTTGYGAKIQDTFVCYASGDNTHGTSKGVATAAADDQKCAAGTGQKFLAIQITGLATAVTDPNYDALNDLFDGDGETNPGTSGRVRFAASGSGTPALTQAVVYFLAIPLG